MPSQPAETEPFKPTVSNLTFSIFLGIAILLDLFKILLFFVNLIPVLGTILDAVGSFLISIIEMLIVFGGLWMVGAYKSSKATGWLLTAAASVIDFIPIVDDLPGTTAAVIGIIIKSRANDRVEHAKKIAADKLSLQHQIKQQQKWQAAQSAQIRANASRDQAMQTSLQAVNDNEPVAANDNVPLSAKAGSTHTRLAA